MHFAVMLLHKYNRQDTVHQTKTIPAGIIIDIARHLVDDVFTLDVARSIASGKVNQITTKK